MQNEMRDIEDALNLVDEIKSILKTGANVEVKMDGQGSLKLYAVYKKRIDSSKWGRGND